MYMTAVTFTEYTLTYNWGVSGYKSVRKISSIDKYMLNMYK